MDFDTVEQGGVTVVVMINDLIIEINDFDMKMANVLTQQFLQSIESAATESGDRAMYTTTLLSMYLQTSKMLKNIPNDYLIAVMERSKGILAAADARRLAEEKENRTNI